MKVINLSSENVSYARRDVNALAGMLQDIEAAIAHAERTSPLAGVNEVTKSLHRAEYEVRRRLQSAKLRLERWSDRGD